MRVQLGTTVKGSLGSKKAVWPKGTIFDDTEAPFPGDIANLVKDKSRIIQFLGVSAGKPVANDEELEAARKTIAELEARLALQEDIHPFSLNEIETVPVDMNLECPQCGKVCKSNAGLSSHMRMAHPDIEEGGGPEE